MYTCSRCGSEIAMGWDVTGRDGMEWDGNVAIIEWQTERARTPSRQDGTGRKQHRFFGTYCMLSLYSTDQRRGKRSS